MHKTILSSWPLFFGISMIMVGSGLQSTLLGVRATIEGFPTYTTGIIMSMYYVGFMFGSHYTPLMLRGVGHIRVFAALASIASVTALFHALFPVAEIWAGVRMVTGFAYAGLYIVIESWLNSATDNNNRGQLMATYLVVLYGAIAAGQYMLTLGDPKGMDLFVLTSILVTLAVLPISLSSRPTPHFEKPVKVSLKELFKSSPLGVFGLFASGATSATLFSIGPVYAAQADLTLAQISTFMAAVVAGGVLMQFPIGWLSDKYDRRRVLIGAAGMACLANLFAIACSLHLDQLGIGIMYLAMFMIGGSALTIYGLSSAHTNDHLNASQRVAASASMLMTNGVGSILGPVLSSTLMDTVGPWMLYAALAAFTGSITVYGLYRTLRRPPVPMVLQEAFIAQPSPSSSMVMQHVQELPNQLKTNNN
jgi:MFS family permease